MPPTPDNTPSIAAPLSPDLDFSFPMDIPPPAPGIASKLEKGLTRSKSRTAALSRINSRAFTSDYLEALHIDTHFVRTPSVKSLASLVDQEETTPRSQSSDMFISQVPFEPNPTFFDAWDCLRKSIVTFAGEPVGTIAALDPSEETLNYNQVSHCRKVSDIPLVHMSFCRQGGAHLARCDWEYCWVVGPPSYHIYSRCVEPPMPKLEMLNTVLKHGVNWAPFHGKC